MRYGIFPVLFFACIMMISCSSGGNSDPISGTDLNAGHFISDSSTQSGPSHMLWGYYTVSIDPVDLSAEVVPVRGAEFTCNVLRFMQPPISPTHMLSLSVLGSSNPADGYFEVDITLNHPFPGLPIYRGFDVRGIMIANGSITSDHDHSATYQGPDDAQLLNADGHTRWWNAVEFTSFGSLFGFTQGLLAPPVYPDGTVNGYKYYSSGLAYDDELWELDTDSRGTFPVVPGSLTRPFHIQFAQPGGQNDFTFNYAIDASWDLPDPMGAPDYDVEFYPLGANMAEPYCLSVVDTGSTAFYEDPGSFGGDLNLAIRVYDWQSVENLSGVAGEINAIWLESPVLSNPVNVLPDATVLPDGPTSSVFEVSLGSLNLTQSGEEPLFVFVEAADTFGYQPQIDGGDAFDYPSASLGTYLLTTVYIKDESDQAPIVTGINPDTGNSGEILTGVEVSGLNFQTGAQVELRHDDWPAIEAENEVTQPGGTMIVCDIDLDAAAEGDWDVAVINPDLLEGILEDGFHVNCGEGVQMYEGVYNLTSGLYYNYCQRGDLTILETGQYAGQCVMKRAVISGGTYPGYYVRFDPDDPSDTTEVDYFNVPGRNDSYVGYTTMTAQIDQNPVNADIAVVNGRMFDVIQMVDEDGVHFEDITITDPQTISGQVPLAGAVDFDGEGDLWVVTNVKGIPDEVGNPIWQLRHYELQDSSPYYTENLSDRLDITDDLYDPNADPWGHMWYAADIAISYTEDSLFVLTGSISGWDHSLFAKYDISSSPPSLVTTEDLLPAIVYTTNPYGISRVDIEFDHTDLSVENCRLLVMYQTWNGVVNVNLMRLDTDFNILADEEIQPNAGSWGSPQAIAINIDASLKNLVSIDMNNSAPYNDFLYYNTPDTSW